MWKLTWIILLPTAIGCSYQTPPAQSLVQVAVPLGDVADVQAAVDRAVAPPRAIIFIHVNWAILQPHRDHFDEFAALWQSAHPELPVAFHRIDFTAACYDYAPITSLPGYAEWEQKAGRHPFGGNGEWAWISGRKLIDIGSTLGSTNKDLLKRTEDSFPGTD